MRILCGTWLRDENDYLYLNNHEIVGIDIGERRPRKVGVATCWGPLEASSQPFGSPEWRLGDIIKHLSRALDSLELFGALLGRSVCIFIRRCLRSQTDPMSVEYGRRLVVSLALFARRRL